MATSGSPPDLDLQKLFVVANEPRARGALSVFTRKIAFAILLPAAIGCQHVQVVVDNNDPNPSGKATHPALHPVGGGSADLVVPKR